MLHPESRFMEDLGFTSFDFMSMLGEIEMNSTWKCSRKRLPISAPCRKPYHIWKKLVSEN